MVIYLFIATAIAYAGRVESSVDKEEFIDGETVLFSITVVGEEIDPLPEMDEIGGVKITNILRNSGSDFIHVDGKSIMERTETITFEFRPTKDMIIPSFQLKTDGVMKMTNAIKLKIVKEPVAGAENPYFAIEMKLDKEQVYVGEPVVATVNFKQKTNVNIMKLNYEKPKFKAFFSKQLDDERTYTDGAYSIHELKYLIVAKNAGEFNLDPATAKVARQVREKQAGGWFANVPKWSNISSTSPTLTVKALNQYHDVVGNFSLSTKIDKKDVLKNKPVTLTIELQGAGSLENFEGLSYDLPDVTVYSDEAIVESYMVNGTFKSRYSKSFTFISDHDFAIPSKTISLFNPNIEKSKTLKTNAYAIDVGGAMSSVNTPMVRSKVNEKQTVIKESGMPEKVINYYPSLLVLFLTFMLGVLFTIFFKKLPTLAFGKWRKKVFSFNGDEALKILLPHIKESSEVEKMVRELYAVKNGEKNVKIDREVLKVLVNQYKSDLSMKK